MMRSTRRLVLASRSPRRRQLLEEAGFVFDALPAPLDDSHLSPGSSPPHHWVAALAYLKASALVRTGGMGSAGRVLVLGSDTVVVKGDDIIGQPRDKDDARRIIARLADGSHEVVTGVALLDGDTRRIFVDAATVTVGQISSEQIEGYLESGAWRGKAGAYNLSERIGDGWPIQYKGDPTCVMGLPMRRLTPMLRALLDREGD